MAKKKVVKEVKADSGKIVSDIISGPVEDVTLDDKRDFWASRPTPETTKQRAIRLGIIPAPKVKGKPDAQSA